MSEPTPVMKQYMEVKNTYKDAIVLFRLGDFYEIFGDDAKVASSVLQITLTTRDKSKTNPIPMCGVPYHAIEPYIKKLVDAGYKVAVCEQVEEPSPGKAIVKRQISRVITPGTYEPENPKENAYILSFKLGKRTHGIALADISTGELLVYESTEAFDDEINRFSVREILCSSALKGDIHYGHILKNRFTTYYDEYYFDYDYSYGYLLEFFHISTLDGFGCDNMPNAIGACGALLSYLAYTQNDLHVFNKITVFNTSAHMFIEKTAITNLDIMTNHKRASNDETLLGVLDMSLTAMGGRFLRNALMMPLKDVEEIEKRLEAVNTIYNDFSLISELRKLLTPVQDLERITSKIINGSVNARDLSALKTSLETIPNIKALLDKSANDYLCHLGQTLSELKTLTKLIDDSITESPPHTVKDGGIIKDGYNQEVDELRKISKKGKTFLSELEAKERLQTGIGSLKISYNKVFGYYIEITKANLHLAPVHYIRKQTLVNAERFITNELKEYENKIIGAEDRLKNLEYQLFKELAEQVKGYTKELRETAIAIATIDFLQSLASSAKKHNYTRPEINESGELILKNARHPVIERLIKGSKFTPNDTLMDIADNRLLIITGPNMAGKSTYMRQIATVIIMAQMGSFIPADYAKIGIVDKLFTRIGASDYITRGQSTFMVEMVETANIVNNATKKSLILLDEVGRGTSTFDGISIAWAVAEYIANVIGARTLFATHYNELTELAQNTEGVVNYNVSVKEWGEEIIFLRKIVQGAADKSYGIQVARLAGMPENIVKRAREVLADLEKEEIPQSKEARLTAIRKKKKSTTQLALFPLTLDPLRAKLINTNIGKLTQEETINLLNELKKLAVEEE
ncbi:MAG: DNA mismatch repair protein MutS [Candidatus Magnetoovum sp. WYHC-5]|nr:DNA mismatch repair protein MutS [Candidatus Magnetoovum sp. WYHC-5]